MKKLVALAVVLALGACKSSAETAKSSSESEPNVVTSGAEGNKRSGKIDLAIKPGGPAPKLPGDEPRPRGEGMKKFDTDGDGQLSDAEREAMREARRDRRMKEVDTNGDGKISDAEREAAQAERDAARQAREAERLARQDQDGDGKVSEEERNAARAERTKDMHAGFDNNGDGKLTTEELAGARWFRGDAAKADANGDGLISTDELQKSIDENRGARRGFGRRGGPGGLPPTE